MRGYKINSNEDYLEHIEVCDGSTAADWPIDKNGHCCWCGEVMGEDRYNSPFLDESLKPYKICSKCHAK